MSGDMDLNANRSLDGWMETQLEVIRVHFYFYDQMRDNGVTRHRVSIPAGHEDYPLVSKAGDSHRVIKDGEELDLEDLLFDLNGKYPGLSVSWGFTMIKREGNRTP